jgi:Protein of unknown function (DUF2628)
MRTYTLHLPPDASLADADALDRAELVPDGFSWGAFLFSALWFFWHRMWVAGLAVLVAVIAFNALLAALDLRPWAGGLAEILFAVLIGLEANSLRRWTLERRGRPIPDVVTARSRDEAELKALARSAEAPGPLARPAPARLSVPAYGGPDGVIGLFPGPERGR